MTSPCTTGDWISANSATVLHWRPELTVRHRIDSTVPGRHRSTGRLPTEEHPGEGHCDEHMRAFSITSPACCGSTPTCSHRAPVARPDPHLRRFAGQDATCRVDHSMGDRCGSPVSDTVMTNPHAPS
jgi:hypothetical protein